MRVTKALVNLARNQGPAKNLKVIAFASVVLDNCLVVRNIRVVQRKGETGLLVAMPSILTKSGVWKDVVEPRSSDMRKSIEDSVLGEMARQQAAGEGAGARA